VRKEGKEGIVGSGEWKKKGKAVYLREKGKKRIGRKVRAILENLRKEEVPRER